MKRRFVINKYKGYSIRNHYFVAQPNGGCMLETDDPDVINLVEGADGYGIYIHPAETAEEIAAMKAKDQRRSRVEPVVEAEREPDPEPQEPEAEPEPTEPTEPLDEPEKKNEKTNPQEEENDEEEETPIAHQGARGTHTGRRQRKGMLITPKEK